MPVKNVHKQLQTEALGAKVSIVKAEEDSILSKDEQGLLRSNALTVEDDPWKQISTEVQQNIMTPTLNPVQLMVLVQQNNTLLQCVEAMEVNIAGTGFEIERKDGKEPEAEEEPPPPAVDAEGQLKQPQPVKKPQAPEEDPQITAIKDFFNTISPGITFTTIRRKLRRDLESCGCAYLEVIRDSKGKIAICDWMDAKLTRLVRLDAPVKVKRTLIRDGKPIEVFMYVRERRFAQIIGNSVRYFKEFGASRDINAITGDWLSMGEATPFKDVTTAKGKKLSKTNLQPAVYSTGPTPESDPKAYSGPTIKGTEVIYFALKPDVSTMYGVPRWVNQIPSALGSRAAEELNLEYFKSGGVPPIILLILGGFLSKDSRDQLNSYLSAPAKYKQRAVIAEIASTSGSIDGTANIKAVVERFGGERQTDSLFENYDERSATRVRSAFRLPPLFVGHAADYSYATAYASYLVAEAQVFKPERDLEDEVINSTIMMELFPEHVYRSKQLTITDIANQLKGLEIAKDVSDRKSWLDEINEIVNLNLVYQDPATDPYQQQQVALKMAGLKQLGQKPGMNGAEPGADPGNAEPDQSPLAKSDVGRRFLSELAHAWAGVQSGDLKLDVDAETVLKSVVDGLPAPVRNLFNDYVAARLLPALEHDPQGVAELLAKTGGCSEH